MQYSQNFYTNVVLFVLALVVLGLSIWAFVAPCKKDGFGDQDCVGRGWWVPACGEQLTPITPNNWNCCDAPDGSKRTCQPARQFGEGEWACCVNENCSPN